MSAASAIHFMDWCIGHSLDCLETDAADNGRSQCAVQIDAPPTPSVGVMQATLLTTTLFWMMGLAPDVSEQAEAQGTANGPNCSEEVRKPLLARTSTHTCLPAQSSERKSIEGVERLTPMVCHVAPPSVEARTR